MNHHQLNMYGYMISIIYSLSRYTKKCSYGILDTEQEVK